MISAMFRRAYKRLRGYELDVEIPPSVMLTTAGTKGWDYGRGLLHRKRYGSVSGFHFRGAATTTQNANYLYLGRDVVFGRNVSINAYSLQGVHIGDRVTIADGANLLGTTVLREPGVGVFIGSDTSIGRNNIIWGQGGVNIGADCLMGPNVLIVSENHSFSQLDTPIRLQGNIRAQVRIDDNCWIGSGATILAGVHIGTGSIIAAGAVVTTSVGPNTVVGGVPGRPIRERA